MSGCVQELTVYVEEHRTAERYALLAYCGKKCKLYGTCVENDIAPLHFLFGLLSIHHPVSWLNKRAMAQLKSWFLF